MIKTFDKRLNEIRRGLYTFNEIGNVETKKQMAEILVREYIDGVITDEALKALISYYSDQINIFKRITLDDVPEPIRNLMLSKK